MRKTAAITMLIAALIGGIWAYQTGLQSPVAKKQGLQQSPKLANEPVEIPVPVVEVDLKPVETVAFTFDESRLYDPSYVSDSEVVAYADSVDRAPECLIAMERGTEVDCPAVSIEAHSLGLTPDGIKDYSDDQLVALSETDPYANRELADRFSAAGQFEKAEFYAERAVALSGAANALFIILSDGSSVDNYDIARLELILTARALGRRPQDNDWFYTMNMSEDDIAEASVRAQARLERLTKMREELVGRPWGRRNTYWDSSSGAILGK